MPRPGKPRFLLTQHGEDETPPSTPESSRTHVPETPPESSRGSNMSLDPFSNLPDDGCPFTELTRGARWNNQECCFPNGPKKLYPPEASRALTTILRSKRALPGEGGEKWSTMSNSLKGYYFQELRKKYYFPHRLMNDLWYTFNTVCSDKYKNMVNKVKASGKKPSWMDQSEYEAWLAYWHRTDVEDTSYKNSQNRLSVPTDGKGVAKHHFGSEAVVTAQVRALDKGEDKTLFDFFKRAKLNAKGEYVDKKSEMIAAAVESRIVDQDLSVEAINKIFLEENPPDEKGCIYGLGSLGVALSAPSSSSSQGSRSRLSEDRLREELAKRDAEYLKLQEEQRLMAEQMQKDKEEMAARFAAQQQQVEELFRQMEAMRGAHP